MLRGLERNLLQQRCFFEVYQEMDSIFRQRLIKNWKQNCEPSLLNQYPDGSALHRVADAADMYKSGNCYINSSLDFSIN